MRLLLLALIVIGTPSTLLAQDMPLSQIIPESSTWGKPTAAKWESPQSPSGLKPIRFSATLKSKPWTYATVAGEPAVYLLKPNQPPKKIPVPLIEPAGVVAWSDDGTLVVADAGNKYAYAFRIEADGQLTAGDRYYRLRVRPGMERSDATAAAIDPVGRVYIAAKEGVHVFDPTGRLCGVLLNPTPTPAVALIIDPAKKTLTYQTPESQFSRPLK
ncbi:SMP-30/Gluconolaconase/LRE domain protein OS=Pirellula staleyi (strain ATCC 27377 / DSM 6068 / ICPB 4128) GN=Psta_1774 PE=4 SV=1 [Tuwongella immobilis]|uniref:SMP-30/Gluconolaconase/LRE domain protein n=2 Tax=Tuwongella immobilis TaxID=692036 RepID=A0A6C2YIR0_9BACT|nr:SMP-30/Gluconolaconase/LRE domain protein OS=Pirellula staleyi (strain ATCC 27377 / DSM 6068 / ICPB 4128) GN=Psta_1774 PE=4 SV=1 [Tuwongella immobilis]VTR98018.1 SMP-30/Gluconolaconase/LRE domain protein OS=Pirellula staleyi (strain ATCC 27377 / DSM 6068 / ICPB 4128) GN=Psta_1774 PE=4 SV=1 [Tuwongella immobilis]